MSILRSGQYLNSLLCDHNLTSYWHVNWEEMKNVSYAYIRIIIPSIKKNLSCVEVLIKVQ